MLTLQDVKNNIEVKSILKIADEQMTAIKFTEHSTRHLGIVSKWAGQLMRDLGGSEKEINMVEIAGYLHDIGNSINRFDHAQSGALLAYNLLTKMGMDYEDSAEIMMAIGNHDEKQGTPVSRISAVLILADKADVHKSRVNMEFFNDSLKSALQSIHDRVNLAAEYSCVKFDDKTDEIVLEIKINTEICPVIDYFEIYFNRMNMCRKAADFLGKKFSLVINDLKML